MAKDVIPKLKSVIHKRIFKLVILFIFIQSFLYLGKNDYILVPDNILNLIDILVFSIITMLIVTIILRFTVSKMFNALEKETDMEQRIFITKMYTITIYLLAFALILWKIGVTANNIAIFLGLAATGIAFAIRDVLMAFFAWYIILQKRPFRINDIIKIGDEIGQVSRIGTFFVTLNVEGDKKTIIKVPNKTFLEKNIINQGKKISDKIKIQVKKFKDIQIEDVIVSKELMDDKKYMMFNFQRNFEDFTKKEEIIKILEKNKII
ncbi:hypothetical protein C0585_04150 [Candidatus Woesearchaeota archaeon]|nr:MAG: hypothetical protein C0585_04150 [Candidatus Woesearchaeota archaeon]